MPRPALQILLAIALALAATYYWDPSTAPTVDQDTSARQQALPRTYLQSTRSWSYDEQGNLTDILEASNVERFPQRNESLITAPRFYSHSGDDRTWSATAEHGRFLHNPRRLLLSQDVVLEHDQTGTRMDSSTLDIRMKTKTARSKSNVTITQGNNRTVADGMIARLDKETITLGPNVESIYVQQP